MTASLEDSSKPLSNSLVSRYVYVAVMGGDKVLTYAGQVHFIDMEEKRTRGKTLISKSINGHKNNTVYTVHVRSIHSYSITT